MNNPKHIIVSFLLIFLFLSCDKGNDNITNQSEINDPDGNIYTSVIIGEQTWMVENLRTTKYNDGTSIPLIIDSLEWGRLTIPAYCWYENQKNVDINLYGALYNGYAVNTGKLCPYGWHVPSDEEWLVLTEYLGGEGIAGGKLKEIGTLHWCNPNEGAIDDSGFKAVPAGIRLSDGAFPSRGTFLGDFNCGVYGEWWTSSENSRNEIIGRVMSAKSTSVDYYYSLNKREGLSIRCIKDE